MTKIIYYLTMVVLFMTAMYFLISGFIDLGDDLDANTLTKNTPGCISACLSMDALYHSIEVYDHYSVNCYCKDGNKIFKTYLEEIK